MAPPIGLVVVVGYLLWPIVMGEEQISSSNSEAMPILKTTWLDPDLKGSRERNPFVDVEPVEVDLSAIPDEETLQVQAGPTLPDGIRLGGTMITNAKSTAIINGQIYQPGDRLALESETDTRWALVAVESNRVILSNGLPGKYAVLDFDHNKPVASVASASGIPGMQGILGMPGVTDPKGNGVPTELAEKVQQILPDLTPTLGSFLGADGRDQKIEDFINLLKE